MRSIVLSLMLVVSPAALSAELADPDAAVKLTEQAMQHVADGDLRAGMELTKPYTVVPDSEFESMIGQAELQMPLMLSRFGKSIGHELLQKQLVGSSLLQVVELHRFQHHATVWRFYFYRGEHGWVLNSFKFVDDITSAF